MAKVGIIMGSDSDLPIMKEAAVFLDELGIDSEVTVVSAHRTPERLFSYARAARERGIAVIIAGAGGAAHLPGMVASLTSLPVIGVPVLVKSLGGIGLDSIYSILQMPPGIPVATMALNGAKNAGILAASILSTSDKIIADKLDQYKRDLANLIEGKAEKLENIGYKDYVKEMEKNQWTT
ncbi:MAG: 5-(carboxyamino)imidazole ribonucleotide mutase [Defluviitaleaceae bacterium]|nr:5-(carboxyamino)imidazole ribonucleotide mutase [Defluviitaleaceae bacterium]